MDTFLGSHLIPQLHIFSRPIKEQLADVEKLCSSYCQGLRGTEEIYKNFLFLFAIFSFANFFNFKSFLTAQAQYIKSEVFSKKSSCFEWGCNDDDDPDYN